MCCDFGDWSFLVLFFCLLRYYDLLHFLPAMTYFSHKLTPIYSPFFENLDLSPNGDVASLLVTKAFSRIVLLFSSRSL